MIFLGIDTSNYTTSAALYFKRDNKVVSKRRMLPVSSGKLGLKQSEALFYHIKSLPELIEELFMETGVDAKNISAVSASAKPRALPESYMPCFLAGDSTGKSIASILSVPFLPFSHQQGHIAAALFALNRLDLLKENFCCWHLSGGTTELLRVYGGGHSKPFKTEIIFKTLDVSAGQLIDRLGVSLGYPFPAGQYVDNLAMEFTEKIKSPAVSVKGDGFNLSGCENLTQTMMKAGKDNSFTARFTLDFICESILQATKKVTSEETCLFTGGVSCSRVLREFMTNALGDRALFATAEYCSDNAVGTAVLASIYKEGIDV